MAESQRRYVAMQFGDNSWIRGLTSRPELNGKHVVLREWKQEEQRWRCEPVGWKFEREFVSVRAKNLHNEPPPKQPPQPPQHPTSPVSAALAAKLVCLVEREGNLRQAKVQGLEEQLKLLLCQRELLEIQKQILECREDGALAQEAEKKLEMHSHKMEAAFAAWKVEGGGDVDFWVD